MGSTAVGIQTKEGVILAVEKRLTSKLLIPSSVEKIMEIEHHVGAAMSGLTADARILVDHARIEATNHWFSYNEPMRVETLTQAVCDLALSFGEGSEENEQTYKMVRHLKMKNIEKNIEDRIESSIWSCSFNCWM